MILTDLQKQMIEGKVCPYCKQPSNLVDSSVVYGISHGLIYLCKPCRAWVGVHKGPACGLVMDRGMELVWSENLHRYAIRFKELDLYLAVRDFHTAGLDAEIRSVPDLFEDSCEAKGAAKLYMEQHPDWSDLAPVR